MVHPVFTSLPEVLCLGPRGMESSCTTGSGNPSGPTPEGPENQTYDVQKWRAVL